jgi:hypothetical protein
LPIPRTTAACGRVRPRTHGAEMTTPPKPARYETLTRNRAEVGSCWASESSTTPMVKAFLRSLCGPGGGGILEVVAGTGEVVAVGGGSPFVVPLVVAFEVVPSVDDPVVGVPLLLAEAPGCALFSPPEDTITATSAPAPASTATAVISQAFLTRPEATLAAAWLTTSKSS